MTVEENKEMLELLKKIEAANRKQLLYTRSQCIAAVAAVAGAAVAAPATTTTAATPAAAAEKAIGYRVYNCSRALRGPFSFGIISVLFPGQSRRGKEFEAI